MTSQVPASAGRQLMLRGGERGQCCDEAAGHGGDPPAFSDAVKHGNPFVGLYVTIKYLHAEFEESVAQHCQMDVIKAAVALSRAAGKRVPVSGWILGCSFRLRPLAESASRNTGSNWVAVSPAGLFRKVRPRISAQNGTCFPKQGSIGSCVPVWGLKTGCSFRLINPRRHSAIQRCAPAALFTENI